ncbi:MAG: hypothetical protein H6746_16620 [Deltaproteobacteria bacterium]|nr:hypothetical protein [Deltaproteobacteria bacterium]
MKLIHCCAVVALSLGPWACAGGGTSAPDTGTLHAPLVFPGPDHGVTLIGYRVLAAGESCEGEAVAESVVALEAEPLPAHLEADPPGGDAHPFGDAFFVLPPGDYLVCATPLLDPETPSPDCAPVSAEATVTAELTTEIVLISQCEGAPAGGLDVVVALNDPPHIDDLLFETSKFITMCEFEMLTVVASDPNGDALSYGWEVVTNPPGLQAALVGEGPSVQFRPDRGGYYEVQVTVDDGHDRTASLTFPIHVSPGPCCAGACGDQSPGGDCYCDDICAGFGDCCADLCDSCSADAPSTCGTGCVPQCDGVECGDDGCGGSCGGCEPDQACSDGLCACVPQCDGLECGDDGCGGSCGTCGADSFCDPSGQCLLNGVFDGFYEGTIDGAVSAASLGITVECTGPMFADVDHTDLPEISMEADCVATTPLPVPGLPDDTIGVSFIGDVFGDQGMGDVFVPLLSPDPVGTWSGSFSGPQPSGPFDLSGTFTGTADLGALGLPIVIDFNGSLAVIQ